MLKLIIDYKIFNHFTRNKPTGISEEDIGEQKYWFSLWEFIMKGGGDIEIVNFDYNNLSNIFISQLVTGVKGKEIITSENFIKPEKCKFPSDKSIHSIYFLDEKIESEQKLYRENNSLAFGFENDYNQVWKKIALLEEEPVLSVRAGVKGGFDKWPQLNKYFIALTDVVIVDNYIFNVSYKVKPNLIGLLKVLNQKSTVKFNLIIVSYVSYNKNKQEVLNVDEQYSFVKERIEKANIDCNLSIVLAKQELKEHDRGIFTNYLRIKSGDSFNFFGWGEIKTKGTELDFYSFTEPAKVKATKVVLSAVKKIIKDTPPQNKAGNFKNRLL